MVADKHKVSAVQAAAMGMLMPAAGLGVMQSVLVNASPPCGVIGGASARYWQALLQAAVQCPPLFEGLRAPIEQQVGETCLPLCS